MTQLIELTKILDSHIIYLNEHISYLDQIQKERVNNEDFADYLFDAFKLRISPNKFKNLHLLELKKNLEQKILLFQNLKRYSEIKPIEKAICLLKLFVDSELRFGKEINRLLADNDLDYKVQLAFSELNILTSLQQLINKQVPSDYPLLTSTIELEIKSSTRGRKRNDSQKESIQSVASCHMANILLGAQAKLLRYQSELEYFNNPTANLMSPQSALENFEQIMRIIKQEMPLDNTKTQSEQFYTIIERHVHKFFIIKPILDKIYSDLDDFHENTIRFKSQHINFIKQLASDKDKLQLKLESLIANYSKNNQLASSCFDLDLLKKKGDALLASLSTASSKEITSFEQLELTKEKYAEEIADYEAQISKLEDHLLKTLSEKKIPVKEKQEMEKKETSHKAYPLDHKKLERLDLEKIEQLNKEATQFRLELKLKTEAFKRQVTEQRRVKTLTKTAQINSERSITPVASAIKHQNPVMAELLAKLNHKKLSLLRGILTENKQLRFKKIVSLIKKHLNGSVSEIGNGSSHKRIELNQCFYEVVNHTNEKVVGTLVKPHGQRDNAGELSAFTRRLLKNLFVSSGITLSLVDGLLDKLGTLSNVEQTIVQNKFI